MCYSWWVDEGLIRYSPVGPFAGFWTTFWVQLMDEIIPLWFYETWMISSMWIGAEFQPSTRVSKKLGSEATRNTNRNMRFMWLVIANGVFLTFHRAKPARQQHPPGSTMPPKVTQNATSSVKRRKFSHPWPIVGGKGVFWMFVGEWMIDVIMTSNLIFTSITLDSLYSTDFNDLNCQMLSVFGGFPYWTRRNQHQESLTQMVSAISNCLKKKTQWKIRLCWVQFNGKSYYAEGVSLTLCDKQINWRYCIGMARETKEVLPKN